MAYLILIGPWQRENHVAKTQAGDKEMEKGKRTSVATALTAFGDEIQNYKEGGRIARAKRNIRP